VYEVVLIASNSVCSASDTVLIEVVLPDNSLVFIPNVFSPNGDNSNDEWWIKAEGKKEISVLILNRWGNVMIELTDFTSKWDGTIDGVEASEGVYFYKYKITDFENKVIEGHGNLTLIR
jgi:gliding motility-associated-like protein